MSAKPKSMAIPLFIVIWVIAACLGTFTQFGSHNPAVILAAVALVLPATAIAIFLLFLVCTEKGDEHSDSAS